MRRGAAEGSTGTSESGTMARSRHRLEALGPHSGWASPSAPSRATSERSAAFS